MKSIFDASSRQEVIERIMSLTEKSEKQWGKMTVSQMARHCVLADAYYLGGKQIDRVLIGKIFGKYALKGILKDEQAMFRKNTPTHLYFRVIENVENLQRQKQQWISLVEKYAGYSPREFEHFFFGKMTAEQLGQLVYKHSDHHLRQFGA